MSTIKEGTENSSLKTGLLDLLYEIGSSSRYCKGMQARLMKDTSPVMDSGFSGFLGRRVGNTPTRSQPHHQF